MSLGARRIEQESNATVIKRMKHGYLACYWCPRGENENRTRKESRDCKRSWKKSRKARWRI